MKGYLSIGAVSKRKNISIKSLRYYDQIGVLTPAYVNTKTNYRYYTEEQLYLLDAISLCVELGIPLKDFEKYKDKQGNFNLQKLLYDGKELAEQKILEIRKRLSTVQAALDAFRYQPAPLPAKPQKKASVKEQSPKNGFYTRNIPERAILLSPLEDDDNDNYSQKILRLFMLGQLLGMSAGYPSGLLYEYKENAPLQKFIFVTVENYGDCVDKRLRILPAGSYQCRQGKEHTIDQALSLAREYDKEITSFIAVETDLIDNEERQGENTLELQLLL